MDRVTKSFIALGIYPFDSESIRFLCSTKVAARSKISIDFSDPAFKKLFANTDVCRWYTLEQQVYPYMSNDPHFVNLLHARLASHIQSLNTLYRFRYFLIELTKMLVGTKIVEPLNGGW